MARSRNKPEKGPSAGPQPVAPQVIYEATLGANGAVIRVQPPINQARFVFGAAEGTTAMSSGCSLRSTRRGQ
jgi:hypothetical protein